MSLADDEDTDKYFRWIFGFWFLYYAVQMLYKLWFEWQNNTLAFPIHTMPLILAILGPVDSIGIWRRWTPAYWIGAAIFLVMPVNGFLIGRIPSEAPMKDILKCVSYVAAAYYLWTMRKHEDPVIRRRMTPEFEALLKKIEEETSYPKGRISLVMESAGPIDMNWLKERVSHATGRVCTVSDSVDNIDLGVEVACLGESESLVGGGGSFAIIGLRGLPIELRMIPFSNSEPQPESVPSQKTAGLMMLSIMSARGLAAENSGGLIWLAPLAIECWTDGVQSAEVIDKDGQAFKVTSQANLHSLAMSFGWDGFSTLAQLVPEPRV